MLERSLRNNTRNIKCLRPSEEKKASTCVEGLRRHRHLPHLDFDFASISQPFVVRGSCFDSWGPIRGFMYVVVLGGLMGC